MWRRANSPSTRIASSRDHVSAWSEVEQRYVDKRGALPEGRRLGCQARICGDLVVDVPAESQVHRQVVRKRAETHPIEIDPVVRLHYVEVREPDMHDPSSDFRRLQARLDRAMGSSRTRAPTSPCCADCRRLCAPATGKSRSRCARGARSSRVMPGFHDRAFGVAFDIGSTTIAAHLCDLDDAARSSPRPAR